MKREKRMKNTKLYYMIGGVLCLIAAVFAAAAVTHPELAFPWPNWVSYTMYALYGAYTILVFCMPKFKGASLAACGIIAIDFMGLELIMIYIGTRNTPHESVLYLMMGLAFTCISNFANIILQEKQRMEK